MRLDQLRYLIHVAEIGSITKSAEDLYISQQGLSQAIQQMEIELGVTLFHRNRNKLTITDAGKKTVEKAKEILSVYNDLLSVLKSFEPTASCIPVEEVDVFSASIINETVLPVTLNLLQNKYQYIKIKVQEMNAFEIPNRITSSSDCVGLFLLPAFELDLLKNLQNTRSVIEELHRYKLMACVAKSSPLAKHSIMSFAEFIRHPLSIYNFQTKVLDYMYKKKQTANIILNTTNIHHCRDTIAKGLAIGFTDDLVEKYLQNKNVVPVPLEEDIEVVCFYMTSPEMLENPTAKELLKVLKSKASV